MTLRRCLAGIGLTVAAVGAVVAGAQEAHEFARYQVILDRMPFGAVGPGNGVGKGPEFAQRYVFVGRVSTTNDGLLAIIQDRAENRNHFKEAGEMIGDVKVLKIEESPPRLVLQKGQETATLAYQPRVEPRPAPAPGAAPGPQPQPQPSTGAPGQVPLPRPLPFRR